MNAPVVVFEPDPRDPDPASSVEALRALRTGRPPVVLPCGAGRRAALSAVPPGSPCLRVAGRWEPEGVARFLLPAWERFARDGLGWATFRPVLPAAVPITSRSGAELLSPRVLAAWPGTGRTPRPVELFDGSTPALEHFFADHTATYHPVPREVAPSPTGHCNFRCANCFLVSGARRAPGAETFMDPALFRVLAAEVAFAGGRNLKVGDTYEPLAHPDLPALVRFARDKGIGCVYMITNASLLDPPLAEALVDSGLDRLFASVNADEEEAFGRATGASYGDVVARICALVATRDRLGARTPEVFVNVISPSPDPARRRASVERWLPLVDGVVLINHIRFRGRRATLSHANCEVPRREPCPDLWDYAGVGADGTVWPCLFRKIAAARGPSLSLGSVTRAPLLDLWHGDVARELRREQIRGDFPPGHPCADCVFWSFQRMRRVPLAAGSPVTVNESPLVVEIRRIAPGDITDFGFLRARHRGPGA